MADDGSADPEKELRQLEDRLREVGERLQAPPDEAEDLLKLLKVSPAPRPALVLIWFRYYTHLLGIAVYDVSCSPAWFRLRFVVVSVENTGGFCALTCFAVID
jgi:hypothetical protein